MKPVLNNTFTKCFNIYYDITNIKEVLKSEISDEELVERIYKLINLSSFKNENNANKKEIALESLEFMLECLHLNHTKIDKIIHNIDPDRDLKQEEQDYCEYLCNEE